MLGPAGWTMPVCEIDLRAGGAWHFVWRSPDGHEMDMHGEYREVSPPERLVSTESLGRPNGPRRSTPSTFSEEDGRTTVVITDQLPLEGSARRRARHGHEAGHEP